MPLHSLWQVLPPFTTRKTVRHLEWKRTLWSLCGRDRWKGKPAWLIRAGEMYLSTPLPPPLRLHAQQFRLQLTPRSHFLSVFETGGHCTDIYYAFQTFP